MSPLNSKVTKALLIPLNEEGLILIQDRENYKPPRWGYFGGSVEKNETVMEALVREAKEELDINISNVPLEKLGEFEDQIGDTVTQRHVFILKVEDSWRYEVKEGKGAKWVKPQTMIDLMREFSGDADIRIAQSTRAFSSNNKF